MQKLHQDVLTWLKSSPVLDWRGNLVAIHKTILSTWLCLGFTLIAGAQSAHTPKAGSKERKEIMDAFRVPIEKQVGAKVIFHVEVLNVIGDWAFIEAEPQQPNGKEIDWSKTRLAKRAKEDDWAPQFNGLLHRSPKSEWAVEKCGLSDSFDLEASVKRLGINKAILKGYVVAG